jgi:ferritin-like protein
MKIRELISTLLKTDDLDTEIIVTYWNKDYFLEATNLTVEQIDTVWEDFVKEAQETIEGHLEFTNTGYDLASDLEELIEGKDND